MDGQLAPYPEPDLAWLEEDDDPLALGYNDDEYTEAPRPEVDEVLETAEELRALHGLRIGQAREMAEALDGNDPGHFEEDDDLIADGVIETMPIATLRQMDRFRCGFIALHEPYARLLNREAIDRDEAMAVEELVQYDFRCEERQFARAHGGDLRLTEPAHLQRYGMLVGLDTLDPQDPYCGLAMSLIDPTTVFPVFGGAGGLLEVYRVYEDTDANIAGNYGGKRGTPEHERLAGILRRKPVKQDDLASARTNCRTVTEVWNDDWFSVVIDEEEELLSRKHGYRRVPFTVVVGNFGLPAATSIGYGDEPETIRSDWGEVAVNDASVDTARRMRPYAWGELRTHRIAEAVAGRQLTMFKWGLNPHRVLEFDPLQKHNQPEIGPLLPGETSKVAIPNKLNLVAPVVDPLAMAGLNLALAANAQPGILGQLASGQIPPQTSGSALTGMIEVGAAADAVLVRLIQLFKRLRAEWRLTLRRDFGGMLGRSGDRGVIAVPASRTAANSPLYRVTPAIIRRTGCDLEVELYNFRPDVGMAQYLTTLRTPSPVTGLPLISDATARRKLKAVADPDREAERIEDEQLLANPAIARQRTLRRIKRERDQAIAEEDYDSADDAQTAVLQLEFLQEQEVMAGQAAPTPATGNGQVPQQPIPEPPRPQLPGTSLPEQGIAVGQEGGRPSGAQPQPMTPIGGPRRGGF